MWDLGTIIAMNQKAQAEGDAARARRREELLQELEQERMDDDGGAVVEDAYQRTETIRAA